VIPDCQTIDLKIKEILRLTQMEVGSISLNSAILVAVGRVLSASQINMNVRRAASQKRTNDRNPSCSIELSISAHGFDGPLLCLAGHVYENGSPV